FSPDHWNSRESSALPHRVFRWFTRCLRSSSAPTRLCVRPQPAGRLQNVCNVQVQRKMCFAPGGRMSRITVLMILLACSCATAAEDKVGRLPHLEFSAKTKQVRVECEMLACNAPLEFFCC